MSHQTSLQLNFFLLVILQLQRNKNTNILLLLLKYFATNFFQHKILCLSVVIYRQKTWDLLMEYLLANTSVSRIQVDKNLLIALHFSKKTVIARTLSLLSDNSFRMGA